jgi:eukaryotic-like serine/threonine-protein kinase
MGEPNAPLSQQVTIAGATPPIEAKPIARPSGANGEKRIGRFTIVGELGRGGYGAVYRAFDSVLGRPCAVKLLLEDSAADAPARERLLREARSAAKLGKHPNIVQVHEAGTTPEGQVYIAMELVEGEPLDRVVKRRSTIPWREAAEIGWRIALALDHAHGLGVIHRDVKPSNVLLDGRGEPQITDFGIAKDLSAAAASLTKTGSAVGTPAFMSPEQAEGRSDVDPRSDVYGVGALLYALIKGRPPFVAPHVAMVLAMVIDRGRFPPRLRSRRNRCPRDLQTVIMKALEKDPDRRYDTAADLAADLRRVLDGEPCEAQPPGLVEQVVRHVRQRPWDIAIVALLVAVGFLTYRYREMAVEREAYERLAVLSTMPDAAERLKICDDVLREVPGASRMPVAHANRAEALMRLRRLEEARATVDVALDLAPLDAPERDEYEKLRRKIQQKIDESKKTVEGEEN